MLLDAIPHGPTLAMVDRFPVPICRFARAYRCQRFRGEAACGWDSVARPTFYGFRIHLRRRWPGLIADFNVAPANVRQIGHRPRTDRWYAGPAAGRPQLLVAPADGGVGAPGPDLAGPLQVAAKGLRAGPSEVANSAGRVTASKPCSASWWSGFKSGGFGSRPAGIRTRLLRKMLSHRLAFALNQEQGNPPLQFAKLLSC